MYVNSHKCVQKFIIRTLIVYGILPGIMCAARPFARSLWLQIGGNFDSRFDRFVFNFCRCRFWRSLGSLTTMLLVMRWQIQWYVLGYFRKEVLLLLKIRKFVISLTRKWKIKLKGKQLDCSTLLSNAICRRAITFPTGRNNPIMNRHKLNNNLPSFHTLDGSYIKSLLLFYLTMSCSICFIKLSVFFTNCLLSFLNSFSLASKSTESIFLCSFLSELK